MANLKHKNISVLFAIIVFALLFYALYLRFSYKADFSNTEIVQAKWSDDLVDSIGINTHLSYPGYNYNVDSIKKDPTKSLITIDTYPDPKGPYYYLQPLLNTDYLGTTYGTTNPDDIDHGGTEPWGRRWVVNIDPVKVRDGLSSKGTLNNTFNNTLKGLLQNLGIRHIRDGESGLFFTASDTANKYYELQNAENKNKNVYPDLGTGNWEGKLKSFCDNGKFLDPTDKKYQLASYPNCSYEPKVQEGMCVRDMVNAYKTGGTVPDCMIILEQYPRYKEYFEATTVNGLYPLKPRPNLAKLSLDSVEGANEVDVGAAFNAYYEVAVPWRGNVLENPSDPNSPCKKDTAGACIPVKYSLHTWYSNAQAKNFLPFNQKWDIWTKNHAQQISQFINATDPANKLVDFVSPSMSFLWYYDEPYYRAANTIYATNTEQDFADSIAFCNSSSAYTTVEQKDGCLENELRVTHGGNARAAELKAAAQAIYNSSSILNQHMYCGQDWPLNCITDTLPRIQNLKSGIDKILVNYMANNSKPMYLTEWNWADSNREILTAEKLTCSSLIETAKLYCNTQGQNCFSLCKIADGDMGRLDEVVQNKYLQRGIFENYDKGIDRGYIYELFDNYFLEDKATGIVPLPQVPLDLYKDFKYLNPDFPNDQTKALNCQNPTTLPETTHCPVLTAFVRDNFTVKDEYSGLERHYGIIRNDFSKKPSYYSIQNITKLLSDPLHDDVMDSGQTPPQPGSLNISYANRSDVVPDPMVCAEANTTRTGNESGVGKTLLQKHDGRYYLVLRNNNAANFPGNPQYRAVKTVSQELLKDIVSPISVKIGNDISRVRVFDPGNYYSNYEDSSLFDPNGALKPIYDSNNSTFNNIIKAYSKDASLATTMDINVPDRIIILELTPKSPTTKVMGVTTSTPNGTYKTGDKITFDVIYNDRVTLQASPFITLNSGGKALYKSGSNSNILTFEYTVMSGEKADSLDYSSVSALSSNLTLLSSNSSIAKALNSSAFAVGGIIDPEVPNQPIDHTLPAVGTFPVVNKISIDGIGPSASISGKTDIYSGVSYDYSIQTSETGLAYKWEEIETTSLSITTPTSKDVKIKPSTPGLFSLKVTVTDSANNVTVKNITLNVRKNGDIINSGQTGGIDNLNNINIADFTALMSSWGDVNKNPMADLNNDGQIDFFDLTILCYWWY